MRFEPFNLLLDSADSSKSRKSNATPKPLLILGLFVTPKRV